MLLAEAIETLLIATKADGRSAETVKDYRRKLRQLVNFLGDIPIEEIDTNDIRRYTVHLMERPLPAGAVILNSRKGEGAFPRFPLLVTFEPSSGCSTGWKKKA
jgi:hypothetical protein